MTPIYTAEINGHDVRFYEPDAMRPHLGLLIPVADIFDALDLDEDRRRGVRRNLNGSGSISQIGGIDVLSQNQALETMRTHQPAAFAEIGDRPASLLAKAILAAEYAARNPPRPAVVRHPVILPEPVVLSVEQRVADLEREVAELRRATYGVRPPNPTGAVLGRIGST